MNTRHIIIVAAALSLAWGCARVLEPGGNYAPPVTISASINEPDKVAITQGDSKLNLAWEAGDQLRVIGNTSQAYTIEEGFTAHQARFTGPKVEGSTFTVLYPGSYESEQALLQRSYLNQTQKGNASTAHLEFNAIARNLTSYQSISFSKDNENVMLSGAMKFIVKLPSGVTKLSSISIRTSNAVFYSTNASDQKTSEITLALQDCDVSESSQILTAYIMTSMQPVNLMKGYKFTFRVTLEDRTCYFENVITTGKSYKFLGGECFTIDMSGKEMQHKISGEGTESNPYAIYDPEDMQLISELAVSTKTTYFQLCADVDMSGVVWTPSFTTPGHTKAIRFAGCNHTLKNFNIQASDCPSIFGELNGSVSDLTIENPTVTGTGGDCAVLCARLGSESTSGDIRNVKIVHPDVSATLSGEARGAGFFIGTACNGTIENVTVKHGSLTASGSSTVATVGGIIGQSTIVNVLNAAVDTTTITNNLSNTATKYTEASATGGIIGKISNSASIACCRFVGGKLIAPSNQANYIGGILGLGSVAATVSRCRSEFDLTARTDVGGIVGYLYAGSIYQCVYNGNLSSREAAGGIVGYLGENSSINDCCSGGSFSSNSQILGGIAGDVKKNSSVTACYSTAKLTGGRVVGGIIGRLSNGGWTAADTNHGNKVYYCLAWNSSLTATGTSSQAGSGAVVGYTGTKNSFDYCYRRYDFSFSCSAVPSGVEPLVDQGRSTSEITTGISSPYWYPYHAAKVSSTKDYPDVATTVKYINTKVAGAWDTKVWNLDVPYPELIDVGGTGGAGGEIPEPKPGIDPGSDWTKTKVADGIDYYCFHKKDAITGKIQSVHVTTVDLNSGKWALKLFYNGGKIIDSDVFKQTGAKASINGGYERPSIVVKVDGTLYFNIDNDIIGDTDVPNWKNEGAVCFDGGMLNDIVINGAGYGRDLSYQRQVYAAMPQKNIISSAPVLIMDYEQVGTSFCSRYSGSYWGSGHEAPSSHQGSEYPRTAIGLTNDGYLLLVVVDGRFSSQAVGMSAGSLTKFMVKYFNPKNLLNLDGGGSSTMCVEGCGDSSTHVVNYPCDNSKFDHAGEREVPTHFYIVPAN